MVSLGGLLQRINFREKALVRNTHWYVIRFRAGWHGRNILWKWSKMTFNNSIFVSKTVRHLDLILSWIFCDILGQCYKYWQHTVYDTLNTLRPSNLWQSSTAPFTVMTNFETNQWELNVYPASAWISHYRSIRVFFFSLFANFSSSLKRTNSHILKRSLPPLCPPVWCICSQQAPRTPA